MCKKSRESVNHLLLHYPIAYELWSMVWALFGLQWVMPLGVSDLFSSWQGSFDGHQSIDLWRAVPHCVLWCIWRERNSRCFEGKELSISEFKSLLLHTLLEWSYSFNLFPCSNFLEMLDLCNLCVWCIVFHIPPVHLDFWLIQFRYLSKIYIRGWQLTKWCSKPKCNHAF